ncbi:heavy metal translocating P-type ATPase [Arthrobacter woluwensis]|uniref:Cu2+-exporting ATPase n=1 Tax=Arthrobacter woluwensis TaxID=156980 RepID=A0A1H4LEP8_9MICC|nr:heavy metal translocating P-type ATPase [Arthrobacter woluwensis]SEB68762.1 Cu2+-exporting ATPase [Arthrobacter woluwensis]
MKQHQQHDHHHPQDPETHQAEASAGHGDHSDHGPGSSREPGSHEPGSHEPGSLKTATATTEHAHHTHHPEPDDDHQVHQHGEHAGHSTAMFRSRFWLTLVLSVPVVFFSPMVGHLLGFRAPEFPGSAWITPVLGTVIFLYGGAPFLKGGVQELRDRRPGMMLLISMAITVAFLASWATTLGLGGFDLDFWWELALLVTIMLLGHWIEMRALGSARGALDALAALLPDEAERLTEDGTETVPTSALRAGDFLLVRSGSRMPADGVITEGRAEFDESMITGESRAVLKSAGDPVVAGTVATDNSVRVRVTAVGGDTALAGIERLVAEAQASSSRTQALADRAAAFLFYFATGAGLLTFLVWALLGDIPEAVTRTVTVLVIACPHALGLAIPLVIAISTERAARAGILLKNRIALEKMRTVDVVLFDKTGTLTEGEPTVRETSAVDGDADRMLALAAAVEADSEHPVARAIVRAARERGLTAPAAHDFEALTGRGARAVVDGVEYRVGGPALLAELDVAEPEGLRTATEAWSSRGAAVLHVLQDRTVLGALSLEDGIRPASRQAVSALQARGIAVAMITGDARQVAEAVASELGIDEVFAEVLPADKDGKVAELQARGLRVAMVGDGVNDSPALARADVGIAIGAGTDVAVESAGVVLAGNDPRAVLSLVELSRASYRKMWQNLIWATGYNVLSVPLAAGVLAFAGVVLSPAAGAVLMSLSTIVVALNAQLLRRLRLDPASLV